MSSTHDRLLKRLGLIRFEIPMTTWEIIAKRIRGIWECHWHGDLARLEQAIQRYGCDCYIQGLMDATEPTVHAQIEKMMKDGETQNG